MKVLISFICVAVFFVFSACKEKKQPVAITEEIVVKDTVVNTTPELPVEKKVKNENQNFFLVAGCFEYKELADKLNAKLQNEGYDSRIVPYYENLYLVSYNGYATLEEARAALKELKKEKGKEQTWIYKSKLHN